MNAICVEAGCGSPIKVRARGLCNAHYKRLQKAGLPPVDRFTWQITPGRGDECSLWTGRVNRDGYGTFSGRTAHRVAWIRVYGDPGPEIDIDHICRNHQCVRLDHLRPRDSLDNQRDNGWGSRTHCSRGHEYTESNTRLRRRSEVRIERICRACDRERQAKAREKP